MRTDYRSVYAVPDAAQGDEWIYGTFPNCKLLGLPCTIKVEALRDGDDQAKDVMGFAGMFKRGSPAIHVSGRDPYGGQTGPGRIRAVGMYSIDWLGLPESKWPAGVGCREPEAVSIVTWDDSHFEPKKWQHHSFWTPCSSTFTLCGIWCKTVIGHPFSVDEILAWIDESQKRPSYLKLNEKPHTTALRRLLETMVGSHNNGLGDVVLRRHTRWTYVWEPRV